MAIEAHLLVALGPSCPALEWHGPCQREPLHLLGPLGHSWWAPSHRAALCRGMLANPTGPLAANPLLVWLAGPTPLPPCPLQVLLHHQLELPPLAQGNKVRHLVVGGVAGEPYSSCCYNVLGVQGGGAPIWPACHHTLAELRYSCCCGVFLFLMVY